VLFGGFRDLGDFYVADAVTGAQLF